MSQQPAIFEAEKRNESLKSQINWHSLCQSMLERFLPCDSVNTQPGGATQGLKHIPVALKVFPLHSTASQSAQNSCLSKKGYSPCQFIQPYLGTEQPRHKGKRLAIVGEAGTGKTLFLQHIAHYLSQVNEGQTDLPIWITPSQLKNLSLQNYLFGPWLEQAIQKEDWPLSVSQASLTEKLQQGQLWILADGIDSFPLLTEENRRSGPLTMLTQSLRPWATAINIVITCRSETRRLDSKGLSGFECYQTRDLVYPEEVEATIREWFMTPGYGAGGNADSSSQTSVAELLCQNLAASSQEVNRDWLVNPLRLILCCRQAATGWQERPLPFPRSSAALYEVLKTQFYQWKAELVTITTEQQQRLGRQLGELGKQILLEGCSSALPLSSKEVETVFAQDSSLLRLALQLGWLIPRGVAIEGKGWDGYGFFDLTFRDYFTALSIDDWHFFLDSDQHYYRIFEPQWQRVLGFWWGRSDIKTTEKETFLAALLSFNDHCGSENFYGKRAVGVAAIALREWGESNHGQRILELVHSWGVGTNPPSLRAFAEALMGKTQRALLLELLLTRSFHEQSELECRQTCQYLSQWGKGEATVIAGLEKYLKTKEFSPQRFLIAETLGLIDPGNLAAIATFLQELDATQLSPYFQAVLQGLGKIGRNDLRVIQTLLGLLSLELNAHQHRQILYCLEVVAKNNPIAIALLLQRLRVYRTGLLRCQTAESLEKLDPGNPTALSILVRLVQPAESTEVRKQAIYSLGEASAGQPTAITALVGLLVVDEDIFIRWLAVSSLAKIGQGNTQAITALENLLINTQQQDQSMDSAGASQSEESHWLRKESIEALAKIAPTSSVLKQVLEQILESDPDPETAHESATILGQIDPGNPTAIAILLKLLKDSSDQFFQRQVASSLGQIDSGNLNALMAMIHLLQNSDNPDLQCLAANSLGEIGIKNPAAIAALIRVVNLTQDKETRRAAIQSLGKVGQNSKEVIQTLLELLTKSDSSLRLDIAQQLIQILPTKFMLSAVHQLRNQVGDPAAWEVLWHCAQKISYPAFYQAWHQATLQQAGWEGQQNSTNLSMLVNSEPTREVALETNYPKLAAKTISSHSYKYLRSSLIEIIQATPELNTAQVIWIDCGKFLDPTNPSIDIYDQMLSQKCPGFEHGIPDNLAKLRLHWHGIQRQNSEQTYILLLDQVSNPALIPMSMDCLEKLTTFQGAIAVLTDQPDIPLTHFSPHSPQLIATLVEWMIQQTH
jgi:HEAT repeat protein